MTTSIKKKGPRRKCKGCTACCTVMGVPELSKPEGNECSHECAKGCAIYSDRPSSCKGYRCEWINGEFNHSDRPDKIGILVDDGGPDFRRLWGPDAVTVRDVDEEPSERAAELIGSLVESGATVFHVTSTGSRLLCSDDGEAAFRLKLEALKPYWGIFDWETTSTGVAASASTGERIEFSKEGNAWLMQVDGVAQ